MTTREKILLLIGFLVASGFGYGFLRYRPTNVEVTTLERSAEETQQKLKQVSWPDEPSPGPEELQRQLSELQQQHMELQQQTTERMAEFVPLEDSQARQQLSLELSQLAERCGLVSEQETFSSTKRADAKPQAESNSGSSASDEVEPMPARVEPATWTKVYGRPLQELRVRCDYHALRRFLAGLEQLPWRVMLVQFEIHTVQPKEAVAEAEFPLEATLVLGL